MKPLAQVRIIYDMKRASLFLILSAFLAACSTPEKYHSAVESWQGANLQDLFSSWGYPDKMEKRDNGTMRYIYVGKPLVQSNASADQLPADSQTAVVKINGDYPLCQTVFIANSSNRIINATSEGVGCTATDLYARSISNRLKTKPKHTIVSDLAAP